MRFQFGYGRYVKENEVKNCSDSSSYIMKGMILSHCILRLGLGALQETWGRRSAGGVVLRWEVFRKTWMYQIFFPSNSLFQGNIGSWWFYGSLEWFLKSDWWLTSNFWSWTCGLQVLWSFLWKKTVLLWKGQSFVNLSILWAALFWWISKMCLCHWLWAVSPRILTPWKAFKQTLNVMERTVILTCVPWRQNLL